MKQGIPEPDEIDEFEGIKLQRANKGGFQFNKPFEGKIYKYDYVSRYSSIMTTSKCIPMKKGNFATFTQKEINELKNKKYTPEFMNVKY